MKIDKIANGNMLTLAISGRLDTSTASQLEEVITNDLISVTELILDLKELEYVSSAGLRVILKAQKKMQTVGRMKVINVNETIMEVFDITGFTDIITIE